MAIIASRLYEAQLAFMLMCYNRPEGYKEADDEQTTNPPGQPRAAGGA